MIQTQNELLEILQSLGLLDYLCFKHGSKEKPIPQKQYYGGIGFIDVEIIQRVVVLHCEGMTLNDISSVVGLSVQETESILDNIIPYL